MMNKRDILHELLCQILGSHNVYFQPPESVKMVYPSIKYSKVEPDVRFANNHIYKHKDKYELIAISNDPENPIIDDILAMPYSRFDRCYVANNKYHTSITLYF